MHQTPRRSRPSYTSGARTRNKRGPATSTIHESKFINKASAPIDEVPYTPMHAFGDFGFSQRLAANLAHIGYESPSPIQDQAIPVAMQSQDIIGLANTGTGKTAAFLLPIIERLIASPDYGSVLVLAPTRELANQIDDEFQKFAAGLKLFSTAIVGGANIKRQINRIERGQHVYIGTPGRIRDLIDRKILRLASIKHFVLDEADRMCDMGFVRDIRAIASELPTQRQTYCFSATMTDDVQTIVEEFMSDPATIAVTKNQTAEHIEQDIVRYSDRDDKLEKLAELLRQPDFDKVIIFGETKYGVQRLTDRLNKDGFSAAAIHGNKSQPQRERSLKSFRDGVVTILVATDVAARGLDIPSVSHVINYDPPKVYADYIHRIGRTGRAGKTGFALTFVADKSASSRSRSTQPHSRDRRGHTSPRPADQAAPTAPKRRRNPSSRDAERRLVALANEA